MIIKITVSRLILMFSSVFNINWKHLCLMSLARRILHVTAAQSGHTIGSDPLLLTLEACDWLNLTSSFSVKLMSKIVILHI